MLIASRCLSLLDSTLALDRVLLNGQQVVSGLQHWDMSTLHSSGQLSALPVIVPPAPLPPTTLVVFAFC